MQGYYATCSTRWIWSCTTRLYSCVQTFTTRRPSKRLNEFSTDAILSLSLVLGINDNKGLAKTRPTWKAFFLPSIGALICLSLWPVTFLACHSFDFAHLLHEFQGMRAEMTNLREEVQLFNLFEPADVLYTSTK